MYILVNRCISYHASIYLPYTFYSIIKPEIEMYQSGVERDVLNERQISFNTFNYCIINYLFDYRPTGGKFTEEDSVSSGDEPAAEVKMKD